MWGLSMYVLYWFRHCVATLLTPRAFSPYERAASSALASGLASNSTPLMASMMAV